MSVSKLKTRHRSDNVTDKFPNINWFKPMKFSAAALAILFLGTFGGFADAVEAARSASTWRYEVIAEYPHDIGDSTQGLLLIGERLIESTGHYGRSALIEKNWRTGKSLRRKPLDRKYFGEGVASIGARIFQLTWLNGIGLIYNQALQLQGQFHYSGEGWGLTTDGARLILSDGTSRLRFIDPQRLSEIASVAVHDQGRAVEGLNELEFARGYVWANLWHSDRIAVIDPASGAVRAWLDFSALRGRFDKPVGWDAGEHVLNGIAYDPRTGHFLLTGKCWPLLFEVAIPVNQ